MNIIKRTIVAVTALLALLAFTIPTPVKADGDNLSITNYFVAGVNGTFTSYPTNAYNPTNNCCPSTGKAVDISHSPDCTFTFNGLLNNTNGTAYYLTFFLVRSTASGPLVNTNRIDYETTPQQPLILQMTLAASQTNVPICWITNLPSAYSGASTWIGTYCVSNNMANTAWITNATATIAKKITRSIIVGQ